jgi:cytoskeletal protein CcmA (bactofilin family)
MSDKPKRRFFDRAPAPATIVASGALFEGRLSGAGSFLIAGEVDGECEIDGTVTLAAGGCWRGILRAAHVIVAGRVEGDVHASGKLEVGPTAHVTGSLTGGSVAIAEGAVIEGEVRVSGGEAPTHFAEKRNDG